MGAPEELIENLTYDELRMHRALTMDDINSFALVSGNVNPAHVYAEGTRQHSVIAHNTFAGALVSTEFPGPGTFCVEQSLQFHRPVRLGDTLQIGVVVAAKDDARHHVGLDCKVLNQRGEQVVTIQALVDAPYSHAAADAAVAIAACGEVAMLMKGSLHTDELMQAVIAEPRLRTGRRMSQVFRFEAPAYAKPLLVTDAAITIAPTLEEKADIVRNAIELAHALGGSQSRVTLLSAVETVTPRLASTLDATALCKRADRGQIGDALLDGPLAFDNAISSEAARIKDILSSLASQADILVVLNLDAGNMLGACAGSGRHARRRARRVRARQIRGLSSLSQRRLFLLAKPPDD